MRILFLSQRLPYAPNRGDRVRAFHLLREMSQWADVHVVALAHDAGEAGHAGDLTGVAASVSVARVPRFANALRAALALPTGKPTTHSLLWAPAMAGAVRLVAAEHRPDVVFSFGTGVAQFALDDSIGSVPLVLDMVDVDSEKWRALATTAWPPLSWVYAREARVLRRFEAGIARRARVTLVVTEKERTALEAFAGGARVEVVENGVDVDALKRPAGRPRPRQPLTAVFCGVMNYGPNVEGMVWFAREVWPLIKQRQADARLQIVGSRPAPAIRRLDGRDDITVTGEVPDVRPYLWDATVAIAPLLTARGVQNKVLEAAAAGLPVVVTPVVFEGLPAQIGSRCSVAEAPTAFCDAVVAATGVTHSRRIGDQMLEELSWSRRLAPLRNIVTLAVRGASEP